MGKTALLVVDVQTALVREHPHCQATLMESLRYLITEFRLKGADVLFARHASGEGTPLAYGTEGWQIDSQLSPDYDHDFIVDKTHNSCFAGTGLDARLQETGVETLVVVGMQTELCVDATIKAALEMGYQVVVACEAVSTFDAAGLTAGQINDFYCGHVWPGRFAEVRDAKDIVADL